MSRSRLPDLADLVDHTGNPYLDSGADLSDTAPDPLFVADMDQKLRSWIDTLPAGSMSGGVPMRDPFYSDDTRDYFDGTPREGLEDYEKDILYNAYSQRLLPQGTNQDGSFVDPIRHSLSRADVADMRAAQEHEASAVQDIQQRVARLTGADLNTINRAAAQMYETYGAEDMLRNPEQFARGVADNISYGGAVSDDASRTAGISGGSGPSSGSPSNRAIGSDGKPWSIDSAGEMRPEDLGADISRQQLKSGYY